MPSSDLECKHDGWSLSSHLQQGGDQSLEASVEDGVAEQRVLHDFMEPPKLPVPDFFDIDRNQCTVF